MLPDATTYDKFIQAYGAKLRAGDVAPQLKGQWDARRAELLKQLRAAIGPAPAQVVPLEPREHGVLKRPGYRIEKVTFQTRPGVRATASAYVPEPLPGGKVPAVLVVHGHWAWARRDPVVQARCLGLVKLGFFVLALDAFGAGERFTEPGRGTYHGAMYGATLWPAGYTLLGLQVDDNRRAVDYLIARPEVDGTRIGVTGASGGGNQTMYAAALDDRLAAAVPVCSVGSYQAYLRAACCLCEVVPGALRFTDEGDVLGLVAPRPLLVINAAKDGYQFSPQAAEPTVARAKAVYSLFNESGHFRQQVFDTGHDYNQAMRELMYGWFTRWLKKEGSGEAIPEPAHTLETPEDLACFAPGQRPADFVLVPAFARAASLALVKDADARKPDHAEDWESTAVFLRQKLAKLLGDLPPAPRPLAEPGPTTRTGDDTLSLFTLTPEAGLTISVGLQSRGRPSPRQPAAVVLSPEGRDAALKHPYAAALLAKGWLLAAPDLRATGAARPAGDAVHNAADHNSAEHAAWVGRPLLGQWACDVRCLIDWLATQPGLDAKRLILVGLGAFGPVAHVSAALVGERVAAVVTHRAPCSLVPNGPYGRDHRLGVLAPGLLTLGDVPHIAALAAPKRLIVANGLSDAGVTMRGTELKAAYGFTTAVYAATKAGEALTLADDLRADEMVRLLG